jgi:hypothetical protein
MPAPPFDALQAKLEMLINRQLELNWTPPALRKSLQASLDSAVQIGITMDLASPSGNAFRPAAGQPTDALSLGVGVSASAAASLSLGVSLGIGFSATASLGAQLVTGLHTAISACATLERDLVEYNAEAEAMAGTNGVMPPGRRADQGRVNRSLRGLNENLSDCQSKANAAAAGRPVSPITAELRMSRIGEWHCDLALDQETTETGKVTFQLDELDFTGTVDPEKTGMDGSRARCKVMAGNGRIRNKIDAHSYTGSTGVKVGTVVKDILKDCGEDLSDLSDGPTLDKKLSRWHVPAGTTAANALTKLAEACDGAWRMLRDGTVWFGSETWPEVEPAGTLTDENWSDGCLTLASETPNMVPGTVYQGQKIEHVTHRYGDKLRTEIRTTSPAAALSKALRGKQQEIDFSREYPCKVVTQNPDGTLQLLPDDEIMRASGLDKVPIIYGTPGQKALVANGARCHLKFAAGDPSRPFVSGWEYDPEKVTVISVLDGARSFARVGDLIQAAGPGTVVSLWPVPPAIPAPPNAAITAGMPCFISFSAVPLTLATVATAAPLFGAVAGGIEKFQG